MSLLCDELPLPTGPVSAYYLAGDLGAPRRICPMQGVSLGGGGVIVADTDHFYGHIVATSDLAASVLLRDDTELFVNAELVRYDSILGAIPASSVGPGHLSVGVTRALTTQGDTVGAGLHSRLVLPTALGAYHHAIPLGLDVGFGSVQKLGHGVYLHADSTLLSQVVFGGGTEGLRVGVGALSGLEWRPGKAFDLVLDLHAGFGFADALDDLSLAPAFRFGGGKHLGVELSAMVPLIGRDRAPLAAADLKVSWRL